MFRVNNISPKGFVWFRSILGVYLFVHFLPLIPYAAEVWGANGLLPDARVNLTYGVLPDMLSMLTDLQIQIMVAGMALLSLILASGYFRPLVALLIWIGWVLLFNRNNLIGNPSLPFIGWLLLICAVVPSGEKRWFNSKEKSLWQFPKMLFVAAWIIMPVSYTISGWDKLNAPGWCDGSAMLHLMVNPLARNSDLREIMLQAPSWTLTTMSYAVLAVELSFLPLAFFSRTRKWIWLAMVITHLGILVFVDFADLTIGMLMIHVFTYDPKWWDRMPKVGWLRISKH